MKLEEKILALRKKRGLSQQGLAKRLKVTRQAVYKWEAGISRPELDKVLAIAQLFNISSDSLLDDRVEINIDNVSEIYEQTEEIKEENSVSEQEKKPSDEENQYASKQNKKRNIIITVSLLAAIALIIALTFILINISNNNLQQTNDTQSQKPLDGSTQNTGSQGSNNGLIPDTQICNHEYKLDSFTETQHSKKCLTCGYILEEIHSWESGACTYCEYYPVGYSKELEFEKIDGVEAYALVSIGKNKESHVKIPPTYNGLPVTRINSFAFQGCSRVTEITLPVSMKFIEGSALMGAGSTDNNYANTYGPRVKLYYEGTLSEFMKISCGQHSNTGHTALYIDNNRVEDLVIPADITEIKPNAFNFICFDSVTIPSQVTKIGENAFSFSDIHNLDIEEGIEEISDSAFYYAKDFDELTLPSTLKKIGRFAFFGTKMRILNIPDSVEYLGSNAFAFCNELFHISLGSGLCYVGSQVFNSCDSLQMINFKTDGTWDIYDEDKKVGTISGEKLSDKPYYYFIWQTPDYVHVKQGYEY